MNNNNETTLTPIINRLADDDPRRLVNRLSADAIATHYRKPTVEEIVKATETKRQQTAKRQTEKIEKERLARAANQPIRRTISLSLIGTKCERQIAYDIQPLDYASDKLEAAPSAEARQLWDEAATRGDMIHAQWQAVLTASNQVYQLPHVTPAKYASEIWLSDFATPQRMRQINQAGFSGRVDLILAERDESGAHLSLGEIKGMAAKDFDPASPYFLSRLKPEQSQAYLWALDLQEVHYIVVNRDGDWFRPVDVLEFVMERNEAIIEDLLLKADFVQDHVKRGELPPAKPGGKYKENCKFCPYKQTRLNPCPVWQR